MQARASGDLFPYDDSVAQLRSYFDSLETLAKAERVPGRRGQRSKAATRRSA